MARRGKKKPSRKRKILKRLAIGAAIGLPVLGSLASAAAARRRMRELINPGRRRRLIKMSDLDETFL